MKSILIVGVYPPPIGGVTRHVSTLTDKLKKLNIKTYILDTGKERHLVVFNFIKSLFRRPSIVHFHTSEHSFVIIIFGFFFKIFSSKIVLSIHSGDYSEKIDRSKYRLLLLRLSFYLCNYIILMNHSQSSEIQSRFPKFKNKIKFCSPYIFPDFQQQAYKLTNNSNMISIATMGLWQRLYAFEDVIKSLAMLAEEKTDINFELEIVVSTALNDLEYEKEIQNFIIRFKKKNLVVKIIENIPDVYGYLARKDLLIRPAVIDSYGICLAEAQFVGTPAIATNVCPRPGRTFLYDKRDTEQLKKIIKDFIECKFKILENRKLLFDNDNGINTLLNLYGEL